MIVYTVNYIVTILRTLMTWRRNERGHNLQLYWSHLTRNILISTQETLIFWENGLFNGSALQWRHNKRDGVSTHQPHDCLLNHLFRCKSKKTPKLRVTGLCDGNLPLTGEFPAQRASNAENVSIWWRHHVYHSLDMIAYIYHFNDWTFKPIQMYQRS